MIALQHRPGALSDETTAEIANCLHRLAESFENRYFAQIRRHDQPLRPTPTPFTYCHERQLHLFNEPCPPF